MESVAFGRQQRAMFTGLSLLRKQEKKTVEETEEQKKLQAYLSKYTSGRGLPSDFAKDTGPLLCILPIGSGENEDDY